LIFFLHAQLNLSVFYICLVKTNKKNEERVHKNGTIIANNR